MTAPYAVYVGQGDYLVGVPARDLSREEYERHKALIEANAEVTGFPLYLTIDEDVSVIGDEEDEEG